MNRIVCRIIAATLWVSPLVLAQEPTSAGSGFEPTGETFLDSTAIAVLPVEVRSTNPTYPQLAEAVYNEFLDQLRKIDGVHVIDPALVKPYSTSSLEPEDIARQLGAATVLKSSVAADPPAYQVRYAFVDVRSGKHHISGSMRSFEEWGPDDSLDERIREGIAETMESVETGIFPDRRNEIDYEAARAEAKARFLNASLSVEDRLVALNALRPGFRFGYPLRYVDGGATLTGDIAIAAAQLATESNDPIVRSTIWQSMIGVGDPNLVDPLLHALANDVDARVRTRAAAALAVHKDAPGVREALDNAMEQDPEWRVRTAAHLAMATRDEQRAALRLTVMDTTLPESERRTALGNLSMMDHNDPVLLDTALAISMVELAKTSTSPRTRRLIWLSLGQMGGAAVVEPLIEAMSSEPDEIMREVLVDALSKLIDDPGVRDALAKAQSNDRSPLVRAAAECALRGGGWC